MSIQQPKFELLAGFPHTEEKVVCIGGQPFYSEGLLVRLFNDDGSSWIANMQRGFTSFDYLHVAEGNKIMAIAGGEFYLIDPDNPEEGMASAGHAYDSVFEEGGLAILFNWTHMTVVEPDGKFWHSERISWDGFKNIEVQNGIVSGLSYCAVDLNKPWVPFTFDLKSRTLSGGGYKNSFGE